MKSLLALITIGVFGLGSLIICLGGARNDDSFSYYFDMCLGSIMYIFTIAMYIVFKFVW